MYKMFKKKYSQQDPETREWFFNGKWYNEYPSEEVENYNERYERYMERKLDERKENK